jgi:arginine/lysine/ornithine decarboxylase
MLGRREDIPAEKSEGRICATPTVSCPPAIPVVICGERITKKDVDRFRRYGVTEVSVIRE